MYKLQFLLTGHYPYDEPGPMYISSHEHRCLAPVDLCIKQLSRMLILLCLCTSSAALICLVGNHSDLITSLIADGAHIDPTDGRGRYDAHTYLPLSLFPSLPFPLLFTSLFLFLTSPSTSPSLLFPFSTLSPSPPSPIFFPL